MKKSITLIFVAALLIAGCGKDEKNNPPAADAGDDAIISIEQVYQLDGSRSMDPESNSLNYEWTLLSSPEGISPLFADADKVNPLFIAYETGEYWFQLRVFDGKNWSDPDSVKITAVADGFVPVARIRAIPENPRVLERVFVTGIESSDPNHDPLNFYWEKLDGKNNWIHFMIDRSFYLFTLPEDQNYKLKLKVDDSRFQSDYAFQEIIIRNSPPYVIAMSDQELEGTSSPYSIRLQATFNDPDNNPVSFNWSIYRAVSGSSPQISDPSVPDPLFTTDKPGSYVLGVKVSDGKEESIVDYVTLCKGLNCPYNQSVSIDPQEIWIHPGFNITENKVIAEFATSSLNYTIPDGAQTFRWKVIYCPTGVEMELLDPGSPLNTTMRFSGDLNMVNSESVYSYPDCVIRLEADTGGYSGDFTFIKSSTDTNTDLKVFFINNNPVIFWSDQQNLVYKFNGEENFQKIKIPLPSVYLDPDGDSLNFYWSVVKKPPKAQVFFPTESNRPDPVVYAGKGRDVIGDYIFRVIVEDGIGGSTSWDYYVMIVEE